jgi:hypothetical protein
MTNVERIEQALGMTDAFASIGVKSFNLTCTDISAVKVAYWAGRNVGALRQLLLPHLVPRCWQLHQNLIVRPTAPAGVVLAQLDDLDSQYRDAMRCRAFLAVQTSPGNYQVWIAIRGAGPGFVSRLVRGIGSDCSASGAGRIAGTPNCKPKYAPDFPMVEVFWIEAGCIAAFAELEEFLAPPVEYPAPVFRANSGSRGWPDYELVLRGAWKAKDSTRSASDYLWCKWAIERGNSRDAVIGKLALVSEHAQEEIARGNQGYLEITVDNAAAVLGLNWKAAYRK